MNGRAWTDWADSQLAQLRVRHQSREVVAHHADLLISFAGNDYLGLTRHPAVRAAAMQAVERFGSGAAASRLISGTLAIHEELEHAIARWQGAERALIFSSGYHANLSAMTVLAAQDVTVFSDALNHASIIDGIRLAQACVIVYRHNDLEHLQALLRQHPGRKLVVSDWVFSMDGDEAPLAALAALCARYDALLVLDEAHAVMQAPRELECEVLRVGTLSKTLASQGGWVAGPRTMIELLVNRARPFIFTTALSPCSAAAALQALRIYTSDEGASLLRHLRRLIDALRPGHASPIVPYLLGDECTALRVSQALRAAGFLVPAIRPPSVAAGTSRLRVALSATHSLDQIRHLATALDACCMRELESAR